MLLTNVIMTLKMVFLTKTDDYQKKKSKKKKKKKKGRCDTNKECD